MAIVGAMAGYVGFALCGYMAVELLSSNSHDRSVEAAMTAFFVAGPIGAIVGGFFGDFSG